MITEIGIVAGEILSLLEEQRRPMGINEIREHLDEPLELVNMSIGWLIREKYVHTDIRDDIYLTPTLIADPANEFFRQGTFAFL